MKTLCFCITFIGGVLLLFTCGFLGYAIWNTKSYPYEAIFNFGDSISDTGNAAFVNKQDMNGKSLYGSTYFKHTSGRMSNGRLIIDFIAEAYGLPFLPAYLTLTKDQDIKKGINFAFGGATAIEASLFTSRGFHTQGTNNSLSVQLGWFKEIKPSLCKSKQECDSFFKKSLFLVGEIGGNDIITVYQHKNMIDLQEIVPLIVESIIDTTNALIEEGVVELAVPGNFPIGCSAGFLTAVNSTIKEDYDQLGCLIAYNMLAEYFNEQLKKSIETLRQKHPQAKIMYFDYYNDVKRFYQAPQQYGFTFENNDHMKACCGGDGPYNVNPIAFCGMPNSTICTDPSKRINWDGLHLTEAAYRQIAKGLVEGPFANPSLKTPLSKIAEN